MLDTLLCTSELEGEKDRLGKPLKRQYLGQRDRDSVRCQSGLTSKHEAFNGQLLLLEILRLSTFITQKICTLEGSENAQKISPVFFLTRYDKCKKIKT